MAKKYKAKPKPIPAVDQKPKAEADAVVAQQTPVKPWSLYDFKLQAIIVGLLALIFYFNSFFNEYAHDDGITIIKNEYVQEGFAGIPKILTKDAYDSYYRQLKTINQLSGGRYRPLSMVTFAIEQQFLGAVPKDKVDSILATNIASGIKGPQEVKLIHDMHIRHVINVLFYILSVIIALYFLRYIVFKNAPIIAFIAAIIFTIHPIHTEVVANVKSRDEIMSLMFMCLVFIFEFKYREFKKPWMLIAGMVSFFLAFLSKEYAITMIVLLPLSLMLFNKYSFKKSIVAVLPYLGVFVLYIALRLSVVAPPGATSDNEVLNNPYFFATSIEKLATEISTSLNYLKLLIFPHPLSADYSYDSIPYKDFGNPLVWLSLVVHIGLVVVMFRFFFRVTGQSQDVSNARNQPAKTKTQSMEGIICFAIAFYLLHLLLVCNIFFDIGATMGERLIYHSSLGFAIAAAYFIVRGSEKIKPVVASRGALVAFMVIIIVLSGFKTIQRNAEWKNDATLFNADLKTVPNSVLVLGNVAAADISQADTQKTEQEKDAKLNMAIGLLNHALSIHHTFVAGYINMGVAYYKMGDMDKAKAYLDSAQRLYPNYPTLPGIYKMIGEDYMKKAWSAYGKNKKYPEAIKELLKGVTIDSANAELWHNLGGAYYSNRQFAEAIAAWNVCLKLNPNNRDAQQGRRVALYLVDSINRQMKK